MASPKPDRTDLARAVRQLRTDRGLTIDQVAQAGQMHSTYLSRIERGTANPTWVKLTSLAEGLGVELAAIVRLAEQNAVARKPGA